MPTVLDSFIVTFGLDSSKFIDGQKQAEASMKKTKDLAVKHGKELEESNRKFAASFDLVKRQAIEFFAIIIGANGIKDFIADVTNATAAIGRLSANLNVSPQDLSAWGSAIERIGGSASEAAGDFQALSAQLYDLRQNGKNIPPELQKLAAEARVPIDINHGVPGYLRSIGKAAAELTRLHGGDRSDSFNFLTHAGIGPGMAQVLIDNGAELDKFIGSLKNLAPTDDQIKKFEELQTAFVEMRQKAVAAGRAIVTNLTPVILHAAQAVSEFIDKNKEAWKSDTLTGVKNFVIVLKEVRDVAKAIVDVLNQIRAWKPPVIFDAPKAIKEGADRWERNPDGSIKVVPSTGGGIMDWLGKTFGITGAHAGTLDELAPRHHWGPWHEGGTPSGPIIGGGSGPHPAPLAVDGKAISRGNPMPVTLVQSETGASGGFWSWLVGGGSPTAQGGGGTIAGAAKKIAGWFGGGNKGVGGWWTPERVQHAADRLQKEAGLSEMGAAGLIARWAGVEAAGGPTSVNSSSGAAGINQALGSRKPPGYAGMSFDQQLDYIIKTDLPSEARAYAQLKNPKTMGDAARGASMYERAEGYNPVTGVDSFTSSTPVGKILGMLHNRAHTMPHRPVSHTPLSTMSALHPVTTSSTANSMHIDQIHVHTAATNAHGIAADIHEALSSHTWAGAMNYGQA